MYLYPKLINSLMSNKNYLECDLEVKDKDGIHVRPAEVIISIAHLVDNHMFISSPHRKDVRPNEICDMLSLEACQNTRIHVKIEEGPHAQECLELLTKAIQDPKLTDHYHLYIQRAEEIVSNYSNNT